MPATQEHRFLAIGTALGPDKLMISRFSMTEQVGRLFKIETELASEDFAVKFDDIVGTNATIRLMTPKGGIRYFNGYVSRFVQAETHGRYASYRATLVPWLWFLTRTSDCRIFQKKKVPDIIEEVFKAQESSAQVMSILLAAIASVSLIVGGIGIMNIMLVSVTERTKEIGLRQAVGAKTRDILGQFLIEAVTLSVAGGAAGIVTGVAASLLISYFADWSTVVSSGSIAVAFLFSALVGVSFGFYPARKAANMDPIEALHYE